ncbi:hypothetical protein D3C85_1445360 [compost metagenome]
MPTLAPSVYGSAFFGARSVWVDFFAPSVYGSNLPALAVLACGLAFLVWLPLWMSPPSV